MTSALPNAATASIVWKIPSVQSAPVSLYSAVGNFQGLACDKALNRLYVTLWADPSVLTMIYLDTGAALSSWATGLTYPGSVVVDSKSNVFGQTAQPAPCTVSHSLRFAWVRSVWFARSPVARVCVCVRVRCCCCV